MATPPPASGPEHEQQQQQQEAQQQPHHGPLSSFLQGLTNLAKPATTEVLIARLGEGNVPLVQSRSCEALAKHAKVPSTAGRVQCSTFANSCSTLVRVSGKHVLPSQESPEQMHEIKAAGGIEALEALRERTHHESVQIAALEALVALQVRLCMLAAAAAAGQVLLIRTVASGSLRRVVIMFADVPLAGPRGCHASGTPHADGWVRAQAQGPQGLVGCFFWRHFQASAAGNQPHHVTQ